MDCRTGRSSILFRIRSHGIGWRAVKDCFVHDDLAIAGRDPGDVSMRMLADLTGIHVRELVQYVINHPYLARLELREVRFVSRQVFRLWVVEIVALYLFYFPLLDHLLNDLVKFDRRGTILILHIRRANQLFFIFFIEIEVNEIEQLVDYRLTDIRLRTHLVQDVQQHFLELLKILLRYADPHLWLRFLFFFPFIQADFRLFARIEEVIYRYMEYLRKPEKLIGSDLPCAALYLRYGWTRQANFLRQRQLAPSFLFPQSLDPESYFLINVHWIPPVLVVILTYVSLSVK